MRRRLLLATALLLPSSASTAQRPTSTPPVLHPQITVLDAIHDTTPGFRALPEDASLSPNGKLIAYTTRTDFRVWNTATHTSSVLLTARVNTFTWGPKGDVIAFSRIDPDAKDKFLWAIRVDPNTGAPIDAARRVGLRAIRYAPRFSPDEQFIAYPRQGAGKYDYELAIVPAAGGAERVVASGVNLGIKDWSPDGSTLYFERYPDSLSKTRFVYSVPASGGTAKRLSADTGATASDGGLLWDIRDFSSGRVTAYLALPAFYDVSDWSGSNRLAAVANPLRRGVRVVNVSSGVVRDLIDTTKLAGSPTWLPDGEHLAVLVWKPSKPVLSVVRASDGKTRDIALRLPPSSMQLPPNDARLQCSPDGHYAAYVADENDDAETIELVDLVTGKIRTLVRLSADGSAPEGKGIAQLMWAPDSKSIRYIAAPWAPEQRAVREVSLTGQDKLVRALPFSAVPHPVWFPTGIELTPVVDAGFIETFGGPNLSFIPLDGGPARVVYNNSVMGGGALSPDKKTMAIRVGGLLSPKRTQSVTLVSLADLSTREIALPFIEVPGIQWAPDGKRFFMLGSDTPAGAVNLYSVPTDGGSVKTLAKLGSTRKQGGRAVSPNGKYVAFTVAPTGETATFVRLDYLTPAAVQAGSKR